MSTIKPISQHVIQASLCLALGILALSMAQVATFAQSCDDVFQNVRSEARSLWSNGELTKAVELLKKHENTFAAPEHQHTVLFYLSLLYLDLDKPAKSVGILNKAFSQSFFFSFGKTYRKKLMSISIGVSALARHSALRSVFSANRKAEFRVLLPKNYTSETKYTLLYFFHGNNSNLQNLVTEFEDVTIKTDVIVVWAQSPYARSNFAFDWVDEELSFTAFKKIRTSIELSYQIDNSKIIAGGFSNGGRFAISLAQKEKNLIKSFLAFSPSKPEKFDTLKLPSESKGAIITGERDYLLNRQIEMAYALQKNSFPIRLIVLPHQPHDFPENFGNLLNSSLDFVLK